MELDITKIYEKNKMISLTQQLQFELQPHSEGAWKINGRNYRPIWPRGTNGVGEAEIKEAVLKAVEMVRSIYDGGNETPNRARITYSDKNNLKVSCR